jgi:hypothetical protein
MRRGTAAGEKDMERDGYNGWKNYETWNVSLWLNNDEGLYNIMREHEDYASLVSTLREMGAIETPDGVSYSDSGLDTDALDEMIAEARA